MKKCNNCGYIELSKQETKIYLCLPATTKEISEKLDIKAKIVYAVLLYLSKYGIVKKSGKRNRSREWIKNKEIEGNIYIALKKACIKYKDNV